MKLQRLAFALVFLAACDRPSAETPKPEVVAPAPAPGPAPAPAPQPEGEPIRTPADLAMRFLKTPVEEDEVPAPKVELPPKPELRIPEVPPTHPDGAYSVRGLREGSDALLAAADAAAEEELRVRAYVQEVVPAVPCPARGPCGSGRAGYAWLADEAGLKGERAAIRIVGHALAIPGFEAKMWKGLPGVSLTPGQAYTFKARFVRDAYGVVDPRGLLMFVAVETGPDAWAYAPGSRYHPKSVALEDERTAAMMRKVQGG